MKSKGAFDCVVGPKDGNRGSWELLRKVGQVKRLVKIQYSCDDCANLHQTKQNIPSPMFLHTHSTLESSFQFV